MTAKNPDNLNVLVVDDDPAYRQLAQDSLVGHKKWIAGTVHEGMNLFRQHHPDICFLDLSLPDDNGLEMLLEIRDEMPEAFVVMLTSSRMTDDVVLAQRCAANGYIVKPFSRKQLRGACEACVKHWAYIGNMGDIERAAFRKKMRNEVMAMQKVLHAPTPETKAALQELLPRWKIMIAGTGEHYASEWTKVLTEAGCSVTHAKTGSHALAQLVSEPYRLLLTEERLEDVDASELLYRMRVNQLTLPAIVVVDSDWKQSQAKWRKVGANRVLCAPVSNEKLCMIVEKEVARSLHEVGDILLQM
jgi:DNA-binding response OmpR family regulator